MENKKITIDVETLETLILSAFLRGVDFKRNDETTEHEEYKAKRDAKILKTQKEILKNYLGIES